MYGPITAVRPRRRRKMTETGWQFSDSCFIALPSQDQDRRVAGYGIGSGASRQQNLSIPFHQVLVDRRHFRIFIRLCRRLRHKETDADYQHQSRETDHSFPRWRPHREVSFRRRRSLSLIISFKSATGRISTGPSPYLKPGSCEIS